MIEKRRVVGAKLPKKERANCQVGTLSAIEYEAIKSFVIKFDG